MELVHTVCDKRCAGELPSWNINTNLEGHMPNFAKSCEHVEIRYENYVSCYVLNFMINVVLVLFNICDNL